MILDRLTELDEAIQGAQGVVDYLKGERARASALPVGDPDTDIWFFPEGGYRDSLMAVYGRGNAYGLVRTRLSFDGAHWCGTDPITDEHLRLVPGENSGSYHDYWEWAG